MKLKIPTPYTGIVFRHINSCGFEKRGDSVPLKIAKKVPMIACFSTIVIMGYTEAIARGSLGLISGFFYYLTAPVKPIKPVSKFLVNSSVKLCRSAVLSIKLSNRTFKKLTNLEKCFS